MPELWMENIDMFIIVMIVMTSMLIFMKTGPKGGDDK